MPQTTENERDQSLTVAAIAVRNRGRREEDVVVALFPDDRTSDPVTEIHYGPLEIAKPSVETESNPLIRAAVLDALAADPTLAEARQALTYRFRLEEVP